MYTILKPIRGEYMGTGIGGAILLEFAIEPEDKMEFERKSANGFFDNYEILPANKNSRYENYKIKNEVLISNYAEFLIEFYNIVYNEFKGIHSPFDKEPVETYSKKLLSCKSREEFDICFDRDARNGAQPFIDSMSLSCLYCYKNNPFLFYLGSYKAYLEEYSTLIHMERMLAKAMTNPLKNAVKFGVFG